MVVVVGLRPWRANDADGEPLVGKSVDGARNQEPVSAGRLDFVLLAEGLFPARGAVLSTEATIKGSGLPVR